MRRGREFMESRSYRSSSELGYGFMGRLEEVRGGRRGSMVGGLYKVGVVNGQILTDITARPWFTPHLPLANTLYNNGHNPNENN